MVKNNLNSFTLIEILIVTVIIVLLSGTSLAIFTTYRDDKVLGNQVTLFSSVLDLAKNKAVSGDVTLCGGDPLTTTVDGFTVVINSTTNTLSLKPECINTTPTPVSYVIPQNIIYLTPSVSLRFNSQNYQGETRTFPIKNTLTGKCKYVTVDETGLITNGSYVTCP